MNLNLIHGYETQPLHQNDTNPFIYHLQMALSEQSFDFTDGKSYKYKVI